MALSTSRQSVAKPGLGAGVRAVLLGLLLAGCTANLQTDRLGEDIYVDIGGLSQPVELHEVPFFAQRTYQCGPAALAAVLTWSGRPVTPKDLKPQIYLPARKGSLQVELVAAVRRHRRVPYILEPSLGDLLAEVADGRPVIVLQNLGLWWYPVWHYAVVVGFDPSAGKMILRSGRRERHTVSMRVFERTWRRSDYWAFVVLRPGELPRTAEPQRYLKAVIDLERLGWWDVVNDAYQAALRRWPEDLVALMGLGNSFYALGDREKALSSFRRAVASHPDAAAAHNNLAHVLAETGDFEEALGYARRAVELDGHLTSEYAATLADIEARLKQGDRL